MESRRFRERREERYQLRNSVGCGLETRRVKNLRIRMPLTTSDGETKRCSARRGPWRVGVHRKVANKVGGVAPCRAKVGVTEEKDSPSVTLAHKKYVANRQQEAMMTEKRVESAKDRLSPTQWKVSTSVERKVSETRADAALRIEWPCRDSRACGLRR